MLDTQCLVRWCSADPEDLDRARLDHLLATVHAARGKLILPTPVIAEFLVRADEASAGWLAAVQGKAAVVIAPFDLRAAFECSLLDRRALDTGDKRGGRKDPWQRIKVDRQVVAIARVVGATRLISDDTGLAVTARAVGILVNTLVELELPASARQHKLDLRQRPDKR